MFYKKLILIIVISSSISIAVTKTEWIKIQNPCLCQEFRCDNGTSCLHKARVCNKYKDCPGGEDETFCSNRKKTYNCSSTEFKCKFGGCINLTSVCDGKIDCIGGVDEGTDFCEWVYGNNTDVNDEK